MCDLNVLRKQKKINAILIKKSNNDKFDIAMGLFKGAEVCDFIDLYTKQNIFN